MKHFTRILPCLVYFLALSLPAASASPALTDPPRSLEEFIRHQDVPTWARADVDSILRDLGPLLRIIPLERLAGLECRPGRIELVLSGEGNVEVRLPEIMRKILDPRRGPKKANLEGRRLRLSTRLRFLVEGATIRMPMGDVEVRYYGWRALEITAEGRPEAVVRDEGGRPFLRTNREGTPEVDEFGEYRYLMASRWLRLETRCNHTIEMALPLLF